MEISQQILCSGSHTETDILILYRKEAPPLHGPRGERIQWHYFPLVCIVSSALYEGPTKLWEYKVVFLPPNGDPGLVSWWAQELIKVCILVPLYVYTYPVPCYESNHEDNFGMR